MKLMIICLLTILSLVVNCDILFAYEKFNIETQTSDFFSNIISDSTLLLDSDLKRIINNDLDRIVTNSKFAYKGYAWPPRTDPKVLLRNIYSDIDKKNLGESLARIIEPVVEIACTPKQYDPLNSISPKCIKNTLAYPVITQIEIIYLFESKKSIDQYIYELNGLNDNNRYQQMVHTIADIMNSAFEKISKKNIFKTVDLVKYPLPNFAYSRTGSDNGSSSTSSNCSKPSMSSIGSGLKRQQDYQADMIEYKHCLDMEKIKAGVSLGGVNQQQQTDEMRRLNGQMSIQRSEMQNQNAQIEAQRAQQQAEMQRQQAEMLRMQQQQKFNDIWNK